MTKKDKVDASSASSSDVEKKEKKSKSRSQSRKRNSIFGLLGNKKEEHDKDAVKEEKKHEKEIVKEEKKHEKEIAKEEHKHDKELAKEEKKIEKEEKQAEAKATHQPTDVAQAGAATVAAAGEKSIHFFLNLEVTHQTAPAAVVASHEKKTDETKPALSTTKSTNDHEKKGGKRGWGEVRGRNCAYRSRQRQWGCSRFGDCSQD